MKNTFLRIFRRKDLSQHKKEEDTILFFDEIQKTNRKLSEIIEIVESGLNELNDKVAELVKNTKQRGSNLTEKKPDDEKEELKEFFMSSPLHDGIFIKSSLSRDFEASSSIYKFWKKPNQPSNSVFLFDFIDDARIQKKALNLYERYVEPVCTSEMVYSPKYEEIISLEPGEAIYKDDKWKTTKKITVKFR